MSQALKQIASYCVSFILFYQLLLLVLYCSFHVLGHVAGFHRLAERINENKVRFNMSNISLLLILVMLGVLEFN